MATVPIKVTPAGEKFEISGETMPSITGSLPGTCTLTKIAGTVPAVPKNEGATEVVLPLSAPPTISCGAGVSMEFQPSTYNLRAQTRFQVYMELGGVIVRYTSLPGCRLVVTSALAKGIWSNGMGNENVFPAYHADDVVNALWQNDGMSACSMAGKTDKLTVRTAGTFPNALVKDTTNPSARFLLWG